jgi:cell division protease FtsH
VFLTRSVTQHKQVSDVTAHAIDEEVRRLIDGNFQRARQILTTSLDKLHTMAEALMKYETIDEEQLKDIMAGRVPRPPSGWDESGAASGGKGGGPQPEPVIGPPASQT